MTDQKSPNMERPHFDEGNIFGCHTMVFEKLMQRLQEKGPGIYISSHETLGIVTEEYHELVKAVQDNDTEAQFDELLDLAVACVAGMASIASGKMQW